VTAERCRCAKSAFALVELLVVVSIIGLLLSILLPSLRSARDQAKGAVCLANLKRLGTGTTLYLSANNDRFPPFRLSYHPLDPSPVEYVNEYGRRQPRWQWFIGPEVGPPISPLPFTPPFGDDSVGVNGESGRAMTNNYFLCPSLQGPYERDIRNGAYGYNYQYLGNSRNDADPARFDNFSVSADAMRAAARTVLIADSRGADPKHGKHSYALDPPRLAFEKNARRFSPGTGDVSPGADVTLYRYSPVEMRHGERGNVVFVDSHAEPMRLAELGYELNPQGVPIPVNPDERPTYTATNSAWNGLGKDPISTAARP